MSSEINSKVRKMSEATISSPTPTSIIPILDKRIHTHICGVGVQEDPIVHPIIQNLQQALPPLGRRRQEGPHQGVARGGERPRGERRAPEPVDHVLQIVQVLVRGGVHSELGTQKSQSEVSVGDVHSELVMQKSRSEVYVV